MITAILILVAFNTGMLLVLIGGICMYKDEIISYIAASTKHVDESIESATTAVFNMDSIKQKVETTGRFEL